MAKLIGLEELLGGKVATNKEREAEADRVLSDAYKVLLEAKLAEVKAEIIERMKKEGK